VLSGWNVLLITIDTLRADRVGFAGYHGASTPVLDRLAAGGVVFENAIASAPVTLPSHATILTGLYPPAHGALDNGYYSLPADVPTLPGILRRHGYETAAFVGAVVLHARYGLNSGFDHYDDDIHSPRVQGQSYRERSAAEVTELAADWFRHRSDEKPFFAWIHYWDPHAPYFPPERLASSFPGRPYDAEVAAVDEAIGRLLEYLRRTNELDRTLIVVTSDHGEAFGDGGELTHGILLRSSTLRVPLVLSAPGRLPEGSRVSGIVSNADVTPTVLELLGVDFGPVDGKSLVEPMRAGRTRERFAYSETRLPADEYGWSMLAGVRDDRWAWVRAPRPELYDLVTDPGETRSLHDDHPEIAVGLDKRVAAILANQHGDIRRSELDESQIEALRSLGYLFSKDPPAPTGADPKDMIAVLQESNILANLVDRGRYEEAVPKARRLLEQAPGNREVLLLLAQSLDQLGRTEEAIVELRKSLDAGGSLDLDGTILAMYLAKVGRSEESAALLRTFAEAEPDFAGHAFNLGNLMSAAERYEEAVRAYERAHELDPEAVHILANLAVNLSRLGERGDPERAIELIDRAIGLSVEDDLPSLIKIEICENLGRTELGLETARALKEKSTLHKVPPEALAEAIRSLQKASR
jgi:arylsulfatase A-like enzyme/Tfp pilus assembly protein PilF